MLIGPGISGVGFKARVIREAECARFGFWEAVHFSTAGINRTEFNQVSFPMHWPNSSLIAPGIRKRSFEVDTYVGQQTTLNGFRQALSIFGQVGLWACSPAKF